jgi:hypothetical protein
VFDASRDESGAETFRLPHEKMKTERKYGNRNGILRMEMEFFL